MKKIVLTLIIMIMAAGAIMAQNDVKQFSIKPYSGFSGSIFTGEQTSDYFDPRYGFHVGVEAEYQFAPKWSMAAGAVYWKKIVITQERQNICTCCRSLVCMAWFVNKCRHSTCICG